MLTQTAINKEKRNRKTTVIGCFLSIVLIILVSFLLYCSGCQYFARQWGGIVKVTLKEGEKLAMITWKGDSLWILTRSFKTGEEPSTYEFKESSKFGVLEGTVIITEKK